VPYAEYRPDPDLRPFLESIWLQRSTRDAAKEQIAPTRVLPTGSVDVAFYYRDRFYQSCPSGREVLPAVTVTGPQTAYRLYGATGRTGIVILRFRPGTAAPFLKCSLHEVRDANVDLGLMLGPSMVRGIEQRVLDAATDAVRVEQIQQFVRRQIASSPKAVVREAVRNLTASEGRTSVHRLGDRMQSSPRQLQRLFRHYVGLTPKSFARIVRFQYALQHRAMGWSWAAVAYRCGYHDQAHLCNEFSSLAGIAPETLVHRRAATPLAAYFNRRPGEGDRCQTIYA
jgi:AraC-like DNA-binding protein